MAAITVQEPSVSGTNMNPVACNAGGDTVLAVGGRTYIRLANGHSSSQTVTLVARQTTRPADGQFPAQAVADIAVVVPNADQMLIGPIPAAYVDNNGNLSLTYSGVTLLTIEAFKVPN
jgi:hypothetical protein